MDKTTDQMLADIEAILNEVDEPIEEGAPVRGVATLRRLPEPTDVGLPEPTEVHFTGDLGLEVQKLFDHIHRAVAEIDMLVNTYPAVQWMVSQGCLDYWEWCVQLLQNLARAEYEQNYRRNARRHRGDSE